MEKETSDFNKTPAANRTHISFFGKINAGKSSIVNAVTGQNLSIVSKKKGTTTDPVSKAMELLPLGPILVTDTPGFNDSGSLGSQRVQKTMQVLNKTDLAILVSDCTNNLSKEETELLDIFRQRQLPFLVVFNKCDITERRRMDWDFPYIYVSALEGLGIKELKETIAKMVEPVGLNRQIIGDRINAGDVVILVTPIDESAPKGRMILPQVQTIRNILDAGGCPLVTQVAQLPGCFGALKNGVAMVITDSQVFKEVNKIVPKDIPLTSFSILFARYKGILSAAASGAFYLSQLEDGNKVLISEGCTHHRQCEDIGTVKLPKWIDDFTGKKLRYSFTSGGEFPSDLSKFDLIVHCGGCMLNEREMTYRMSAAQAQGVPFTNYGTLIAHINGILERSLEVFK